MSVQGGKKARKEIIRSTIQKLHEELGPQHNRLFLVGGSWRAIALIDMERRGYPLHVLHEYRMSRKAVTATAEYIAKNDEETIRAMAGISSSRMKLVPIASEVLKEVVR